jgi:hypothetical protein
VGHAPVYVGQETKWCQGVRFRLGIARTHALNTVLGVLVACERSTYENEGYVGNVISIFSATADACCAFYVQPRLLVYIKYTRSSNSRCSRCFFGYALIPSIVHLSHVHKLLAPPPRNLIRNSLIHQRC